MEGLISKNKNIKGGGSPLYVYVYILIIIINFNIYSMKSY